MASNYKWLLIYAFELLILTDLLLFSIYSILDAC